MEDVVLENVVLESMVLDLGILESRAWVEAPAPGSQRVPTKPCPDSGPKLPKLRPRALPRVRPKMAKMGSRDPGAFFCRLLKQNNWFAFLRNFLRT